MKILLACAQGMSTSILVKKMQNAAAQQNKNYKIWATSVDGVFDEDEDFDVILVGPQVSKRADELKDEFTDIPVEVIPKDMYGRVDGESVLAFAESLVN